MNKLLWGVMVLLLLIVLYFSYVNPVESGEDIEQLVRQVAQDYRAEQGFQGACYVGSQEVSLGALMYGIGVMEGGFKEGSAGRRTNNVGSLRRNMGIKKAIGTECVDNTCDRPVYESMYDGLYEKAYVLVEKYGCSFRQADVMCYIYGCNAERTEKRIAHANSYLSNVKKVATQFDSNKGVTLDEPTGCIQIDWSNADYIQIDSKDGEFIDTFKLPEGLVKVFKCFQ